MTWDEGWEIHGETEAQHSAPFLRNVLILLGVLLLSQAVITAFQIKESMEEQVEENLESRAEAIAGESTSSF